MTSSEKAAALVLMGLALQEDVGNGDITTDNLIPAGEQRKAAMIAKTGGVIAGLEIAEMVFRHFDPDVSWSPEVSDGDRVSKGDIIVNFSGSYRALLTGERTALNFLQRLSGIATASAAFANAVLGTGTTILDTRKTLPGFRLLDKYAVKAGGASNHRIGLYDMVMVKDNHIAVAGGIANAVKTIREKAGPAIKVEVETTCLGEVQEAIDAGADIIMLDNMDLGTMKAAVELVNNRAKTEASGNMTLDRVREVALTGVDYISVGALTHSVKALDISMRIY